MSEQFSRTELILGQAAMEKLAASRVAVFGVGGVGGFVVEGLARAGMGALDLIDNDEVAESNLNRQIIALHSTVGRAKVMVAAERVRDINPDCKVTVSQCFFLPENASDFDFSSYDYVVDAIDTVTGKLALIECCKKAGTPVISAMGAGNKLDPTAFKVADLFETRICPLAKIMRKECRKRGIDCLKVVYSEEEPLVPDKKENVMNSAVIAGENESILLNQDSLGGENNQSAFGSKRRSTPGSVSFVPSVVGLIIAGEVVKDLINYIV